MPNIFGKRSRSSSCSYSHTVFFINFIFRIHVIREWFWAHHYESDFSPCSVFLFKDLWFQFWHFINGFSIPMQVIVRYFWKKYWQFQFWSITKTFLSGSAIRNSVNLERFWSSAEIKWRTFYCKMFYYNKIGHFSTIRVWDKQWSLIKNYKRCFFFKMFQN